MKQMGEFKANSMAMELEILFFPCRYALCPLRFAQ